MKYELIVLLIAVLIVAVSATPSRIPSGRPRSPNSIHYSNPHTQNAQLPHPLPQNPPPYQPRLPNYHRSRYYTQGIMGRFPPPPYRSPPPTYRRELPEGHTVS